jgi:amino acid transporter
LLLANYLCSYTLYFSANTRLPMVAGWDHLLPGWFARLHSKYKTPVNSILFMGGIAVVASMAVLIGVGEQEAFAQLQIWSWAFYGLAYLAMFAIPLVARKDRGIRPGLWLRVASGSGFLVTLAFVVLSIVPIVHVESVPAYVWKTAAVLIGTNGLGAMLYHTGRRKAAHSQE